MVKANNYVGYSKDMTIQSMKDGKINLQGQKY